MWDTELGSFRRMKARRVPAFMLAVAVLIAARRQQLCDLLDGWDPDSDDEFGAVLDRLARALVAEMPEPV